MNPHKENSSVHYSLQPNGEQELKLNYNISFNVKYPTDNTLESEMELQSISLNTNKAKLNDKVYVDMSTNQKLTEAMLSFIDETSEKNMVVYLKDLNTKKPYFIVPYTTELATYDLNYVILQDENGKETHYRKDEETIGIKHFDFNSSITIEKEDALSDILYLDNDKITLEILKQIEESEENITITINAENDPIIDSALFEAIKDANKNVIIKYKNTQWIFNGKDITDPKEINVSVSVYNTNNTQDEADINAMLEGAVVIDFAKNGQLPGKCLIRVQATESVNEIINKDKAYVYYYDEENKKFEKVMLQAMLTSDNYYEFYINHNSKYVMTAEEIDEQYVSSNTEKTQLNTKVQNNNISSVTTVNKEETSTEFLTQDMIIKIVIAIVCVILLILLLSGKILSNKKSKAKNGKKEQ